MSSTDLTEDGQGQCDRAYRTNRDLLRSEIRFWQELIHSNDESITSATNERMEHALALAESRLADLCSRFDEELNQGRVEHDNVYFIGRQRQA